MLTTRRRFLQTAPATAFGLSDLSSFHALADEKPADARRIVFAADIEPIVRLI
jgi:hypothetical protein